jgi:uncharacterized membrane protein YeiH
MRRLILAADLTGTAVFALQGALAGVAGRLDVFGVPVLACLTALGGGMMRDVLLATAPAALRDWRYPVLAVAVGVACFAAVPLAAAIPRTLVVTLDAAGLALFAVAGAQKSIGAGLGVVGAALLGMLSAVGGGVLRDVLLGHVPAILRADIYATAALAGATIAALAGRRYPTAGAVGVVCFTLRMLALHLGWHLPAAG